MFGGPTTLLPIVPCHLQRWSIGLMFCVLAVRYCLQLPFVHVVLPLPMPECHSYILPRPHPVYLIYILWFTISNSLMVNYPELTLRPYLQCDLCTLVVPQTFLILTLLLPLSSSMTVDLFVRSLSCHMCKCNFHDQP